LIPPISRKDRTRGEESEDRSNDEESAKPKPKKVKAKKPTKDDLLHEADELLRRIEQQEAVVRALLSDFNDAKEECKHIKGAYHAAQLDLQRLCRARKEKMPLFDGQAKPDPALTQLTDGNWKSILVTEAGFNAKQADALTGASIKTLGDLQAKIEQHGTFWPKEIGVHGRHQQAIEDRLNQVVTMAAQSAEEKPAVVEPQAEVVQPTEPTEVVEESAANAA
jgi:hypothetical protein